MFDRIRHTAVAATLLLVASACSSNGPTAGPKVTAAPTSTVAPTTGPTLSPTAPAAAVRGIDWEVRHIIYEDPLGREPSLTGVLFTGSGFMAWGRNASGGSAAIASNADTSSWGDAGQFDGVRLAGMAWAPSGIVALGTDPKGVVHAWRSVDGTTWLPGPARTGIDGVVNTVISVSGAYYAAGTAAGGCDVAVWISFDGLSWQPSDPLPGARGTCTTSGPVSQPTITLLHNGVAGIVAYGTIPGQGSAFWTSGNRVTWSFHPQPSISGHIAGLAETHDGYMAVGSSGTGSAAVWLSADGATWAPAPDQATLHGAALTAAQALDDGSIVAVGGDTTNAFVAWTSPDGRTWTKSPAAIDPSSETPRPPDPPWAWALASDGHASTAPSELLVAVGGGYGAIVSPPTTPRLRAGTVTVRLSGLVDVPETTGIAACSADDDRTPATAVAAPIDVALLYLVVSPGGEVTDFRISSGEWIIVVGQGVPVDPSTFTVAPGSTPQRGSALFHGLHPEQAPPGTESVAGTISWTCAW